MNLEPLIRFPELLRRDSACGIGRIEGVTTATASYVPKRQVGEPAVSVRELRKTYPGGVEALRGISFDVSEGEIFGMVGPNGAGKTTTIGVLTTTVRPSGGWAVLAGHDIDREPLAVRRAMGVVFQDNVLDNEFSGLENLRLHARLWRMPRAEAEARIASLVDTIELNERIGDGVRTYSGGMRRRLEIARAVLAKPRLLFLDEPTVGLDPAARHTIWDLIQRLRREEGVTVVLTTHYLDEAERLCDRVAIIHQGRVVALDTPEALIASLGVEVLELHVNGEADEAVRVLGSLRVGAEPLVIGKTVTLPLSGDGSATQLMEQVRSSGLLVAGMGVRRTTLDDVFIHLTGSRISGENGS